MSTNSLPQIILASSSVYRKELLSRLKLPFDTASPDIDESPLVGETPSQTAVRLSQQKALAIANLYPSNSIIIGSDQVAQCENHTIGKPGNFERALIQLKEMQGKAVHFHTGLSVIDTRATDEAKRVQSTLVSTRVVFRQLPDEELSAYLNIEKPFDCAGSAKNEALGIALLESIESTDPTALTGLPLIALTTMLRNCGIRFFNF